MVAMFVACWLVIPATRPSSPCCDRRPLNKKLTIDCGGEQVLLRDGETVLVSGKMFVGTIDVPPAPSLDQVTDAESDPDIRKNLWFDGCFVCGTGRAEGDGLRIFADRRLGIDRVADIWVPPATIGDDQGLVPDEIVWAALDCPAGWACWAEKSRIIVLGRMAAEIIKPVPIGQPCIVMAWKAGELGRRIHTGSALFSASGEVLAKSRANWIELPAIPA